MTGLVYKDLLIQRKLLLLYLLYYVIFGGMCAVHITTMFTVCGVTMFMGLTLTTNSFVYDNQAKWETYAAAAPGGYEDMVLAKYLFSLLITLCSGLMLLVLDLILYLGGGTELTPRELLPVILTSTGTCLVINSIMLPCLFRLGAEKARIVLVILLVLVCAVVSALYLGGQLMAGWFLTLARIQEMYGGMGRMMMPLLLPLLLCAVVGVSLYLSLRICKKKEF